MPGTDRPEWLPDWTGEIAIIVASGPSAKDVPLDLARGKARFVTVNRSFQLAPWADIAYAADLDFWNSVNGMPRFSGLRVTVDEISAQRWGIHRLKWTKEHRIVFEPRGTVGWGSASGFQALNLAIQTGIRAALLVGFDCRVDRGIHWHGPHERGLRNPKPAVAQIWREALDGVADDIEARGITIINASEGSALRNYRRMDFERALLCLGLHSLTTSTSRRPTA